MKIKTLIAIFAMALVFTNCKKGDTGPAGQDGTNGNANVTSVTLTTSSWAWNSSQKWRYATWNNVSILNTSVINDGVVMLYQLVGTNSYVQLPITQNQGAYAEHDWFEYSPNTISVYIENSDLSDPNPSPFTYKLVCIPKSAKMANPNVNWKNYTEVKNALNLKD